MHPKNIYWATFCLVLLFSSCQKEERPFFNGSGKKPIYAPLTELTNIGNEAPRPIQTTGSIYLLDTLFFILDPGQGIHVFNISDSTNTVALTFMRIPAITDFTIADNRIYADSWTDLVVIDISNLYQIKVTSRIADVISPVLYPPLFDGFFECVDRSKGAVVGWEDANLIQAKCSTAQ